MAKRSLGRGAVLSPVPAVMVSCALGEETNIVTVAWCGTVCTKPSKTYISLRPSRHSYGIIKESGYFVINLVPSALAKKADYCGTFTGAKVNKFEKCGFTPVYPEGCPVPLIAECPVSILCRVEQILPLGSHDMFLAEVVEVFAEEALFDSRGALRLDKAGLCAYAHGSYYELGKRIGAIGFSATKKKPKGRPTQHGKSKN
ncbi:MAG: flavin reductase family protein [Clostridia bacterium]|nr:flavin reductase family protein [Clostridia bacterium]